MKKLLKIYELNSDQQYFEMIVESFFNGQMQQAKDQFCAMPKKEKISFLKGATVGGWNSGLAEHKIASLFDLL